MDITGVQLKWKYRIRYINRKAFAVFTLSFKFAAFASPAGRLRNCNAAAFAFFKKYASHFLNSGKPELNQKRAAYAITGLTSGQN